MSLTVVFVFLLVVLIAGGFYIAYLETKVTKLKSEILGLKNEINIMKRKEESGPS